MEKLYTKRKSVAMVIRCLCSDKDTGSILRGAIPWIFSYALQYMYTH